MSFSIVAVGTVDEVRDQIRAHDLTNGGDLAQTVKSFLAEELFTPPNFSADQPQTRVRYVIEATGHADAYQVSLTINVRPVWTCDTTTKDGS